MSIISPTRKVCFFFKKKLDKFFLLKKYTLRVGDTDPAFSKMSGQYVPIFKYRIALPTKIFGMGKCKMKKLLSFSPKLEILI